MAKVVKGSYSDVSDARELVERLLDEGYPANSITLVAGNDAAMDLDDLGVYVESGFAYNDTDTDETLWERIKHFFGFESDRIQDGDFSMYRDSIRNGDILVLVDEAMVPSNLNRSDWSDGLRVDQMNDEARVNTVNDLDYNVDYDRNFDRDLKDDDTLRLEEERLNVQKQQVKSGEVSIRKHVVENVETVEVPVRHEEVVIERRAVNDQDAPYADFEEETITVPVMEEQVQVTKRPVVTEEIKVRKRDVERTQQVSETLRKEKLDVDKNGNAIIMDEDKILSK